ncbi:MAG: thioredoxin domain-containing protein [Alphaproteobacteria bacterium]|nr:thioredoxin domain-containing protein [Alphaproteobacteria bacterium]
MDFRWRRLAAAVAFVGAMVAGIGPGDRAVAQEMRFDSGERAEIEDIVRNYLLENPEIIMEAVAVLRAREERATDERQQSTLAERRSEVFDSPTSPSIGDPDSDIVLVEFFDYNCGYCKRVVGHVFALAEDNPDLRIVFKEFPILAQSSELAARAALAAANQGLYAEMHNALMTHRGGYDEATILDLAEEIGADAAQLRADMDSDAVDAEIAATADLAIALGIRGTPAFIIGDMVIPGAVDLETLQDLVDRERDRS